MGNTQGGKLSNILKRGNLKKLSKKFLLGSLIAGAIYGITAGVYATKIIYKVKTNYAVAIEKISGERIVISGLDPENVGWKFRAPFFTKFEKEISLMQRKMYFADTIVSKDKISLLVSTLLIFSVVDPYKWAIEIENAESLLQGESNGLTKDVLQSSSEDEIIQEREKIKNIIFKKLKTQPSNIVEGLESKTLEEKYGIKLVSSSIVNAEYPKNLMEASQRKKELELIADGEEQAILTTYQGHATGVKKFMAETGLSKEETINYLNQQRWASAYEKSKDQKTYVINNTNERLGITIPTEDTGKKELEKKILELEKENSSKSPIGTDTPTNKKTTQQEGSTKGQYKITEATRGPG